MAPQSKNIVLTGGARGIGRSIARTLLEHGHRVFIIDIDEEELTHAVKNNLKKYSSQLSYSVCDLRDPQAIRKTISKAAEHFDKHIDVVISNGGIASPKWKDEKSMDDPATLEQWQAYIDTNLTAPFALSQAAIPFMKRTGEQIKQQRGEAGPCIVLVGSFRAHQSDPDQEGYASSKAGQLGLMHSMAISCSQWGIRVNLVAPGRIKVQHECREGDEKGLEWAELNEEKDNADHAVNRAGMPEDIAHAIEYMMEAAFVTGQDITVDGGATKTKSI